MSWVCGTKRPPLVSDRACPYVCAGHECALCCVKCLTCHPTLPCRTDSRSTGPRPVLAPLCRAVIGENDASTVVPACSCCGCGARANLACPGDELANDDGATSYAVCQNFPRGPSQPQLCPPPRSDGVWVQRAVYTADGRHYVQQPEQWLLPRLLLHRQWAGHQHH